MRIAVALFKYGFGGAILILIAVYLCGAFLTREIGVEKYEKEFLAATLFWLVGLALAQAASAAAGKRSLAAAQADLATLARVAAEAGTAPEVRFYEGDEVYEATRRAVSQARKRVWVTYLRGEGPARSAAAEKHFQACREWAMRFPGRSFRRIILYCDTPAMSDFYAMELRTALEADDRKRSYHVRLLDGSVHATEAFSVGIYDDVVIFTHNDGPDHVFAFSIRSEKLANQHIREYYNRLWNLEVTRPIQEVFSADDYARR
ncbi:hypothetical protein Rhe02_35430 [Rhizocola hellebori]|uniref:Uncharacterized protein n=1 Tax=Rhizocola hellebori TaxID=1392758 RepID=A0A8J3Q7V3_9ACTN|nr:hypothetical protein [Rhizocola hellebori]GIH05476.1 hypothetical protein Rhe02_35430 [Rhizocola hellebori]